MDLVGLIRRASVASGTECRMRRERLIRPTVLCSDLVGLIRRVMNCTPNVGHNLTSEGAVYETFI
ncbi:hypothetical protein E4499_22095 [Escherichia coli]|nr:hypothetical protein [Escherichia coli]